DVRTLAADIDPAVGGIVAVGAGAHDAIRLLRAAYPDMVLIQQPSTHEKRTATAKAPFPFATDDEQHALFTIERSLDDYLDEQLVEAAENVALWHADLGALDAIVHGALGGAVGVTSTHRHIVAPEDVAHSPSKGSDRTPNVLLPEHLRYKKSQAMTRDWFANG